MKQFSLILSMVLLTFTTVLAQKTVTGTVTDDASGEPLIGANVTVEGTNAGTVTEFDGTYSISASEGDVILITYTGYTDMRQTVGASNTMDFKMSEGILLDNVVVTALGITKEEKAVGYSVQEVGGDDIVAAGETNLVQSLSSKVAGVQVTGSSGAAGGSSYFTIRGVNSINGNNQPLIVIDGVPVDNSQLRSGSAVASVAFSNRAIDINQDEIENISVLKGAAATALYGSQAGNGAIIITTKNGKIGKQKISIDFSHSLTFNQISQTPELQNQYAQGRFQNYEGPETGSGYSYGPAVNTLTYDPTTAGTYEYHINGAIVPKTNESDRSIDTYDQYDFFRTGVSNRSSLAVSAGNEFSSLRVSFGYQNEQGIIPLNDFQKLNFGINANTKLGEKVKLGVGLQYINSGGTRIEQGSNTSGVMLGLTRTAPSFDNSNGLGSDAVNNSAAYILPDGSQRNYRGGGGYDNPYWTINQNPLNDNVNRIIGNISLEYRPTSWLTLMYRPGIDFYSDFRKQHFAIGSRTVTAGRVFEDQFFVSRFNADLLATFTPKISEDFGLSFTLGNNMRSFSNDNVYVEGTGLVIPDFYDISNAGTYDRSVSNLQSRDLAFYAMADFDYKKMLYLSLTGRMEGSTTLPQGNNWFPYGSVSTSFVFSELLENLNQLSFGKIRLSYGVVGLGSPFFYATDDYFTSSAVGDGWTDGFSFPFGSQAGFSLGNALGNPELRPEKKSSFEAGVDLRFFKDRLSVDFSYYNDQSSDIILAVPIAGSTGSTSQVRNAASLSNKGIELVVSATPVRTKDFSWNVMMNFTRNRNEVLELAEGVDNVFLGGFTGSSAYAVKGLPYSTIFGFGWLRDAAGNVVIESDPTSSDYGFPILDQEEKPFESYLPDFTMGLGTGFDYKGLTFNMLWDFKKGGYMWNGTKSALYFWGTHQETADLRYTSKVFEGALATYDDAGAMVMDESGNPVTSGANDVAVFVDEGWLAFGNANGFFGDNTEDFVESTSWVRLRSVSLGYSFPKSMIGKTPFESLSVNLSARNVFLWTPYTGVDPETNLYGSANAQGLDYFNMPGTKSYALTLRVGF